MNEALAFACFGRASQTSKCERGPGFGLLWQSTPKFQDVKQALGLACSGKASQTSRREAGPGFGLLWQRYILGTLRTQSVASFGIDEVATLSISRGIDKVANLSISGGICKVATLSIPCASILNLQAPKSLLLVALGDDRDGNMH